MQPDLPLATIAFVPRETFCQTRAALDALIKNTAQPYELICVDGGSPAHVRDYLAEKAREHGFTLLRSESFLTPNQARNIAAARVSTRYVVFIDNDVFVTPGWLTALVGCAAETGAWAVGPLYFEHEPLNTRIHMAGGECRIDEDGSGFRSLIEKHTHAHELLADVPGAFARRESELLEFHTMLVAMEAFATLGPLDENLTCTFEHGDLCLAIRAAGRKVVFEPASRTTYVPPKRLDHADDAFFQFRWSESAIGQSLERIRHKHRLSPNDPNLRRRRRWLRFHRRHRLVTLNRIRKIVGRRLFGAIEAAIIVPLDNAISRRRFPAGATLPDAPCPVEQVAPPLPTGGRAA